MEGASGFHTSSEYSIESSLSQTGLLNNEKLQYSPKIMHAQEVAQEVLHRKNMQAAKRSEVAVYPQEVQSARSSKSYAQEAARS